MKFIKQLMPWLAVIGPGVVVMLADTDAGSLITSAQMGASFGYKLVLQSLVLIPILFLAQELTVRLGLVTKQGHGELIKNHFGKHWAWLSVSTLLVSCVGAMITELVGLIGVGNLFGISPIVTVIISIGFLLFIVYTGSYHSVEKIAILLGSFELFFIVIAFHARPNFHVFWHDLKTFPADTHAYLYLTAANIGAVVMPWMIFYQQSAVVDKKLKVEHLQKARWDTAIGAIVTQVIMVSVLIAVAATISFHHGNVSLNSVEEISHSLTPYLGDTFGRIVFSLGMLGACMVAAIVVTCTAAWGLGEVLGYRRSLSDKPKEAPWFYTVYTVVLVLAGVLVTSDAINPIKLGIGVEVMNALLLPIVLTFLFLLACKTLPEKYRLKGTYKIICGIVLGATAIIGAVMGIVGLF